ncbi:MAG: pantoate--beta-alanine ligase [Lactobacillales bacterium]|jgi:pantoate--beta-alanine ligase|nr:pantoate--beta-alanine ligase [Lactobacillales bacterium]
MLTIYKIEDLKAAIPAGVEIGFVPTMGALHEGHASLIARSVSENKFTIVSTFVNPTQFAPGEDFESYPRDEHHDRTICEEAGADIMFFPSSEEMYPEGFNTYVNAYGVSEVMEGVKRPTHFRGVTTVLAKLFNLTCAKRVYMGAKDAQQVSVVEQMVRDLNFDLKIVRCPIIREASGLAKSSRNKYLNETEKSSALVLIGSLELAKSLIESGVTSVAEIRAEMTKFIEREPLARIDSIDFVDFQTLQEVETVEREVLIPIAVYIGKTRLIDNIVI